LNLLGNGTPAGVVLSQIEIDFFIFYKLISDTFPYFSLNNMPAGYGFRESATGAEKQKEESSRF